MGELCSLRCLMLHPRWVVKFPTDTRDATLTFTRSCQESDMLYQQDHQFLTLVSLFSLSVWSPLYCVPKIHVVPINRHTNYVKWRFVHCAGHCATTGTVRIVWEAWEHPNLVLLHTLVSLFGLVPHKPRLSSHNIVPVWWSLTSGSGV